MKQIATDPFGSRTEYSAAMTAGSPAEAEGGRSLRSETRLHGRGQRCVAASLPFSMSKTAWLKQKSEKS